MNVFTNFDIKIKYEYECIKYRMYYISNLLEFKFLNTLFIKILLLY